MHYDPIKQFLSKLFNRHSLSRKLFYRLLDILLLRTWHVHKALHAFRATTSGKGINVLDAGSGLGQYVWYMARKNPHWHITAVDIKEADIQSCKDFFKKEKLNNAQFEVQDLTKYRADEKFDLVLSVDVFEHIEDDVMVFSNLFQSMKPGGLLLISTPSDQGGSDANDPDDTSFIEEHVRNGYPAEEIRNKLADAGFEAVEVRYTYGKPGSIAWRISMKYPMRLLGYSKAFLIILPVYYLIFMPAVLILNYMDVIMSHSRGTGLLVKAWKPKL